MYVYASDVRKSAGDVLNAVANDEKVVLNMEAERQLGMESTWYLSKHILGFDQMNNGFHLAMCNFWDRNIDWPQLHLHPRKHFKTSCIGIGGNIRLILNDPNITIGLIANNLENSKSYLTGIRAHFMDNPKFRDLYPEHKVDGRKEFGRQDSFITPARTDFSLRFSTIECSSVKRVIVSRHYKRLHFDDIVDQDNVATKEKRDNTYDIYATSLATCGIRNGLPWHCVVGTRWDFDDIYQRILERHGNDGAFKIFITSAEYDKKNADGSFEKRILFPENFTQAYLDHLKDTFGMYWYSCLYLNDPVPAGSAALDTENIVLYDYENRPKGPVNRCITVDPSTAESMRKGDPSVVSSFEMDSSSNLRCLQIRRGWWDMDDLVYNIIDAHKNFGIRTIGVEKVSFQKWLCHALNKIRREQGLAFNVVEIPRSVQIKKTERHNRLIYPLKNGQIWVRRDEVNLPILKREWNEWPKAKYDDITDTFTDALEILKPAASRIFEKNTYRAPRKLYTSPALPAQGNKVRQSPYPRARRSGFSPTATGSRRRSSIRWAT